MTIPIKTTELATPALIELVNKSKFLKDNAKFLAIREVYKLIEKETKKLLKAWEEAEKIYTLSDIEQTDFESIAEFTTDIEKKLSPIYKKLENSINPHDEEIRKLISKILDNLSKIDWITGELEMIPQRPNSLKPIIKAS